MAVPGDFRMDPGILALALPPGLREGAKRRGITAGRHTGWHGGVFPGAALVAVGKL